ncbi:hypothetical protein [Halomonas borealis]|nr:hypothetical protein [Halomonas borealis]
MKKWLKANLWWLLIFLAVAPLWLLLVIDMWTLALGNWGTCG